MRFHKMLADIYDQVFAPPGALEPETGALDISTLGHEPMAPTSLTETHYATDMDVAWHNGFGTAPDYSVPAAGFTSFDHGQGSLFDSSHGSGFSDDFGSRWD